REVILQVLYRDREVRNIEEERIRWKGSKSGSQEYKEKSCARCRQALGLLLNRGAVCQGCSHRVCAKCRVFLRMTRAWKCTVCFEDRPRPVILSMQARDSWSKALEILSEAEELGQFKGFNKSVENLFLSVTTHMKKLSKSQNDMTSDKQRPAVGPRQCEGRSERRSQSDTAVNVTTRVSQASGRPKITLLPVFSIGADKCEFLSSPPPYLLSLNQWMEERGSLISINSTCTEMGSFDNANVTGEIELAIRYCFRTRSLEICIKACKNLAYGEEKKKKCNPYVKTYLLPERSSQGKRKTGVQKNTVEPTFQETLKYQLEPSQLATRQLRVSVWHLGTLARRVFLGEVIIPLATWDFEDRTTQSARWYPLQAKAEKDEDSVPANNGELVVRAKLALPAGPGKLQEAQGTGDEPSRNGQLCLVVLGAKNLPVRSDGTLNSFVKGCLTLPDQQRLRLKSPVLKKQACPQWKYSFVFKGVTPSQLRQSTLELTVWDQATFGVNDRLLGGARLGSKEEPAGGADSCSRSKLQWQKVLSSPNLWTDMTLTLH
ncbi:hypothetical protein EI555_011258, partial [Monodon monoceros]